MANNNTCEHSVPVAEIYHPGDFGDQKTQFRDQVTINP